MNKLLTRASLGLTIPLIGLAGCGSSSQSSGPIKVKTATGTLTLAHAPRRIVSLSPTGTEDLYAVGAGKQVVAVDRYSTYPTQAPKTALTGLTPNIEAIAGYRPDLVVVADDSGHIVEQMAKLRIATLVEPPATNLESVYSELQQIATATGHPSAATSVVAGIRSRVAAIVRSVPPPRRTYTVYHELEQTLFSANSHTFIGQLYAMLSLRNIADAAHGASDYPKLSAEYVVRSNPDLIVLADTVCCAQSPATVAARAGWKHIAAVRTGQVVPVDDSIASEWGPRIVIFLQKIADAVKELERH